MEHARVKPSEDLYPFFAIAPDPLCVLDLEARFVLVNPAFENTIGFTQAELEGSLFLDFVASDDRALTETQISRLIAEPVTVTLENHCRCNDGSYRWLRWNCSSDSARPRIYLAALDLTEPNHMLDSLIMASPQPIIAVDNNRMVTVWNPAAERTFGWPAKEVLGGRVPFVSDQNQRESSDIFNERALSGEKFRNLQMRRTRRDGTPVDLLVSTATTRDKHGHVDGFVSVAMDITEHKKLEQQLFRAQRLESLGTLASGIAHDLNNVLAPIAMSLELFRVKFPDRNAAQMLDSLDSCVHRGADLIRQILTFARGVQGDRVPVQTRHLLLDTEKVLMQTFPKSIDITSRLQSDLWAVNADVTQLHQVLMNLCVNARDAMPDGGNLTITAQNAMLDEKFVEANPGMSAGPHVSVEVSDTGHGISPEIRDKIFEPFFTTKEVGRGTGLGLSTVSAIVRNHGGVINVSSEVGVGTSFKILFPALPGLESVGAADANVALPGGRSEVILVVDDEAAVRDITKLTLENHGYHVLVASDGAEGVAVYAQHKDAIKLVISDQDMPVMNGAAMIRSLERINPKVRVISASGLAANGKANPLPAPSSGLRVLLTKPFTAEELLRTVHDMLSA